jgi:hypothetical protein
LPGLTRQSIIFEKMLSDCPLTRTMDGTATEATPFFERLWDDNQFWPEVVGFVEVQEA